MMLHRKTTLFAAVTLAASSLFAAFASPAQDLFDEASARVVFNYGGFATTDLKALTSKYQAELDKACGTQGEACPYAIAHDVIEKMVEEIGDEHTGFYKPAQNDDRKRGNAGIGNPAPRVGISHREIEGSTDRLVVSVRSDSPAAAAGLQRGDRIVGLNGKATSEFGGKFTEAISEAVGTGKPVVLNVLRGGEKKIDFTIVGKVFDTTEMPSIVYRPDGFAVLRIPDFQATLKVGNKVHELVAEAKTKGVKGIVVDLRGNPGGKVIDTFITIGAFIPKAAVIMTGRDSVEGYSFHDSTLFSLDKAGKESPLYRVPAASRWDGPLAVLVNAESFSGAEYFAAAVDYFKRGLVIGETTGGLGNTSSLTFDLHDGSAIQVTISRSTFEADKPYPDAVKPAIGVKDDLVELARSGRDLPLDRAIQELSAVAKQ
jgi:carboxyl-terminal processing protease